MEEENRHAAVLAAADATRFADRQGGDVWLAAAQLDSALLALRTTAPHTCFQGELLPEMYSIALAHMIHRVSYHWLLGESCRRRGRAPSMVLFLGPLFCAHCADPGADVVCACAVRRALVQAELLAFHTTLSLFLTLLLLLLSLSLSP